MSQPVVRTSVPSHWLVTCKSNQGRGCTVRRWTAGVERACACLTIGSRLMAPPSTILAAVAAVRPEPAATSTATAAAAAALSPEHAADEAPRLRELAVCPTTVAGRPGPDDGGGLVLVRDGPIGPRDVIVLHEIEPRAGAVEVVGAVSAGIASAPLAPEESDACVEGLLRFGAVPALVRGGIEVKHVGQVVARHPVGGSDLDILRPCGGAEHDDILGVGPDHRHDPLVVRLDDA